MGFDGLERDLNINSLRVRQRMFRTPTQRKKPTFVAGPFVAGRNSGCNQIKCDCDRRVMRYSHRPGLEDVLLLTAYVGVDFLFRNTEG